MAAITSGQQHMLMKFTETGILHNYRNKSSLASSDRCVCVWFLSAQYFSVSFSASKSLTIVKLCRERNIDNISLAALPKLKKKFNVSHPPLFPTIPFVNVVVDNLHLFLRVADVLINHLIEVVTSSDML